MANKELRIVDLCKQKGVTQRELAARLGIKPAAMSLRISKGNPSLESLAQMADALGVEIPELFAISAPPKRELRIDEVLYHFGLTRVELARRMNVSPPALTAMLNNRSKEGNITFNSLERIAAAIGCNVEYLYKPTATSCPYCGKELKVVVGLAPK